MDPYRLIGQAVQNASAPDLNFLIAQRQLLDRQIHDQVRQNQMATDQEDAIDRIKLDDKLSRERQKEYLDSQFKQSRELAQERSRLEQEAAMNQAKAMLPGQAKVLQFHMAQMEMADRKIDNLLNQDSDLKQAIDRLTVEALRAELNPRDLNVIVKNGQIDESAFPKLGSQQKRVSKIYKKARENALFDAQQQVSETSQPLLQQVLRTYGDEYLANSKAVGELMTKNPLLAESIDEIMVDFFRTAKQAYGGGEGAAAPAPNEQAMVDMFLSSDEGASESRRLPASPSDSGVIGNLFDTVMSGAVRVGGNLQNIGSGVNDLLEDQGLARFPNPGQIMDIGTSVVNAGLSPMGLLSPRNNPSSGPTNTQAVFPTTAPTTSVNSNQSSIINQRAAEQQRQLRELADFIRGQQTQ